MKETDETNREKATEDSIRLDWFLYGESFLDIDGYRIDPRDAIRSLEYDDPPPP